MIMPVACGDAVNFDISVTEINKEPDEDEYNGDKHDIMAHNAADIHEAAKKGAVSIDPYRYGYAVTMKTKLSVSEIKLHEYEEQEEFTRDVLPELNAANNGKSGSESGIERVQPAYEPCVPQFISSAISSTVKIMYTLSSSSNQRFLILRLIRSSIRPYNTFASQERVLKHGSVNSTLGTR